MSTTRPTLADCLKHLTFDRYNYHIIRSNETILQAVRDSIPLVNSHINSLENPELTQQEYKQLAQVYEKVGIFFAFDKKNGDSARECFIAYFKADIKANNLTDASLPTYINYNTLKLYAASKRKGADKTKTCELIQECISEFKKIANEPRGSSLYNDIVLNSEFLMRTLVFIMYQQSLKDPQLAKKENYYKKLQDNLLNSIVNLKNLVTDSNAKLTDIAETYLLLARIYSHQGKFEPAINALINSSFYWEKLNMATECIHPNTAETYHEHGRVLIHLRKCADSRTYLEKSLKIWRDYFKQDDVMEIVTNLYNIAQLNYLEKSYEKSFSEFLNIIPVMKKLKLKLLIKAEERLREIVKAHIEQLRAFPIFNPNRYELYTNDFTKIQSMISLSEMCLPYCDDIQKQVIDIFFKELSSYHLFMSQHYTKRLSTLNIESNANDNSFGASSSSYSPGFYAKNKAKEVLIQGIETLTLEAAPAP